MRPNALKKAIIGLVTVGAVAAVNLVGAGTSFAATARDYPPAAGTATLAPLAVVNLGLSTTQARYEQCYLRFWDYTGALDGQLGPESWKAKQRYLAHFYGYTGRIDGVVGSGTVSALQRSLREWGYTGAIDGIAGPRTQAAFRAEAEDRKYACDLV